jgi:hypothetical protein
VARFEHWCTTETAVDIDEDFFKNRVLLKISKGQSTSLVIGSPDAMRDCIAQLF